MRHSKNSYRLIALLAVAAPAAAQTWVAPDFFVRAVPRSPLKSLPNAGDCRATIAAKLCLVHESAKEACLPGGERYAPALQKLHDEFPPALQGVFCELKRIYVHEKLESTAYGGLDRDPSGNVSGAIIGIRQSILDQGLSLSKWATWKEQLPFGGDPNSYDNPTSDLPLITAGIPGAQSDALYFILAHEFGHIIDFRDHVNSDRGWSAISWTSVGSDWTEGGTTKYDDVYPLRRRLDFYGSGPKLAAGDTAECYSQLQKTDFVSLYAGTNPYDDFAETVAYFSLARSGGSYAVRFKTGDWYFTVDMADRLNSPQMRAKIDFVRSFLTGSARPSPSVSAALLTQGAPFDDGASRRP